MPVKKPEPAHWLDRMSTIDESSTIDNRFGRRTCINPACGIEYTPTHHLQQYHSKECHNAAIKDWKSTAHECPVCGTIHVAPMKGPGMKNDRGRGKTK